MNSVSILSGWKKFKELQLAEVDALYNQQSSSKKVIIDVKSIFEANTFKDNDYIYWNL